MKSVEYEKEERVVAEGTIETVVKFFEKEEYDEKEVKMVMQGWIRKTASDQSGIKIGN